MSQDMGFWTAIIGTVVFIWTFAILAVIEEMLFG